ncbi:N-alpha-acetyltransferase 25, NatB auxiliary subunit [Leucoagaricus sp. SymC.cos]|nr:N-alpha-acetyltransferase 25, NatB auxiliary subunit [Leucoagaricus sp. SymC.cos]
MSALALERQIRPIYDALDTGSNKSAIVSCNKLLKKYPQNELIKALKALALVRSQKIEESLVLCDQVLQAKPTSDATLTAMMHVLRGLGRHKDMVKMFEEAYKQQPQNEELGAQTFFANVRANQWKSAQLIATRMNKSFQDDRYLYWTVMSTVLQAGEHGTEPQMREILYKLAHRLIVSSPTPSYINSERFHLHLSILLKLDLIDDAHKLLDSQVGKNICATSLSCNELRREVWKRKGLVKEEGEIAKALILEKGDRNWLEFLSVLEATFLDVTGENCSGEAVETTRKSIQETRDLFSQAVEKDGLKDRSGLLGLLELEKRSRKHGVSDDQSRLLVLLKDYLEKFGDKPSCFEDLRPYLDLKGDDLAQWKGVLNAAPTTFVQEQLRRLINLYKFQRYHLTSSEITHERETALAKLYTERYLEALKKTGFELPSTELHSADDLALLAASSFVSLWKLTAGDGYLYSAAALLEYGLTRSKHAFMFRLYLIRIYRLLSAPNLALDHYRLLRPKQVQNDTLSHLILSRSSMFSLASTGDLTFATECLESTQIYLNNAQETSDFIIRAFTAEKYSQIPEFISFEEQLENSLQRDLVKVEHLKMRLAHENVVSDVVDMELIELKFIFDRDEFLVHFDNRDTTILPNYQPKVSPDFTTQTNLFNLYEGPGYLRQMLRTYIRAFVQGSDLSETVEEKLLIGDRPKLRTYVPPGVSLRDRLVERSEEDLKELTQDEITLVDFATALADWLEVYHNHARPHPLLVLAEASKQSELKTGHPLKGIETPPLDGNGLKKDEEPPACVEPPELVTKVFDDIKARFMEVNEAVSPLEALHVAAVAQEAFFIFTAETNRFKNQTVVKQNKLGALVNNVKNIRANALANLKDISAELIKRSQAEATAESRKAFIDHDIVLSIAKKETDARKKVIEGFGKGLARVCSHYAGN